MELLDMSSKMNIQGGKTAMGYSSYMGEKKQDREEYTEGVSKDKFI